MSIEKDLENLGRAHRRFAAATAEEIEGKIVRRIAKLEKERDRLHAVMLDVWQRQDKDDIRDRPALALDIAIALGFKASARNIAQDYGERIVADYPNYRRDVIRLLKPSKKGK